MPTISDKIRRLMREHGDTTRSLGTAVDATSAAVTGWRNGAVPRPDAVRKIADYYGVPVEVLTNDALDLPATAREYLSEAPARTAVQMADAKPGEQSDRQKAFEEYIRFLQALRAEAEAAAPGDPAEARRRFDHLLATWLSAFEGSPGEMQAARRKLEDLKRQAAATSTEDQPRGRRHG